MAWRLAKSLTALKATVDALAPNRSKRSDGGIGDAGHATRASDHNPWVKDGSMGVVTAFDFTHDPLHGMDAGKVVDSLRASLDPRVKYFIYNRRICNSQATAQTPPWTWRQYYGSNPHDKHFHISVKSTKPFYDSVLPWKAMGAVVPPIKEVPVVTAKIPPIGNVKEIQSLLRTHGYDIKVDGKNGPKTQAAIKAFQKARGLKVDGKVGPITWAALKAAKGPPVPPTPVPAPTPSVPPSTPILPLPKRALEVFTAVWEKRERAAGLIGNFQQESYMDLRPEVMGDRINGDYTAFGIAQHRNDRFLELVRFALVRRQPWTNFETQLGFINQELISTERYAGDLLRRADTIEEAVAAGIFYLRPAGIVRPSDTNWITVLEAAKKGHGWNNRLRNAKALMG